MDINPKWILTSKQMWGWLFTVIPLFLPVLTSFTGKTVNVGNLGAVQDAGMHAIDTGFLFAGAILGFIAIVERMLDGLGVLNWLPGRKPAVSAPVIGPAPPAAQ